MDLCALTAAELVEAFRKKTLSPVEVAQAVLARIEKLNPVLKIRDSVEPHQSMDRMICANFDVPDSTIETRRRIIIRVEDVDGVVSEIAEAPRQ